jgi:hypothetical protein
MSIVAHRSPVLLVMVVMLLAGGCSSDSDATAETVELPAEASAAIDGTREAMNSYDFEAMRPYLTEDFTFQSYREVTDLEDYIAYLNAY